MKMPRTRKRLVKNVLTQVIGPKNLSGTCLASEADQENTNKDEEKGGLGPSVLIRHLQC